MDDEDAGRLALRMALGLVPESEREEAAEALAAAGRVEVNGRWRRLAGKAPRLSRVAWPAPDDH